MNPKKVAIIFLLICVICIIIIISGIFYLIIPKENNENIVSTDSNMTNNFIETENSIQDNIIANNISQEEKTISEQEKDNIIQDLITSHPEIDFNTVGIDWDYDTDSNNMIIEESTDENTPPKQKELTQEQLDIITFNTSYENMPEEDANYINGAFGSFENFEKELKKVIYNTGFFTTTSAKYSNSRKINGEKTILIYFNLDNYYSDLMTVLINLDDNSWDISKGGM